jgi:hypothetical protein
MDGGIAWHARGRRNQERLEMDGKSVIKLVQTHATNSWFDSNQEYWCHGLDKLPDALIIHLQSLLTASQP